MSMPLPIIFTDLEEAKAVAREKHKILGLDMGIVYNGKKYMIVNLTLPKRDLERAYLRIRVFKIVWCICAAVPHDHWVSRTRKAKEILENIQGYRDQLAIDAVEEG